MHLICCIIIQDCNDTTDVWQDNMTLQYISLLTEVLVLKFIDNCLQCLGTILLLSPSSGFESFVHFSSLKSLFMIYLAHIVVNDVDIGHIMTYKL
jgi:hypothetical protein